MAEHFLDDAEIRAIAEEVGGEANGAGGGGRCAPHPCLPAAVARSLTICPDPGGGELTAVAVQENPALRLRV